MAPLTLNRAQSLSAGFNRRGVRRFEWCTMGVRLGHCTRNDCALAATVATHTRNMGNQTWYGFLMAVQASFLPAGRIPALEEYFSVTQAC